MKLSTYLLTISFTFFFVGCEQKPKENDSLGTLVSVSTLLEHPKRYLGKHVETYGFLVNVSQSPEVPLYALVPLKDYSELVYHITYLNSVFLEFKRSHNSENKTSDDYFKPKNMDQCINHYVSVTGIFGPAISPTAKAIKDVEDVIVVEKDIERICVSNQNT